MSQQSQDIKTLLASLEYPEDLTKRIRDECVYVESGHLVWWPKQEFQGYLDEFHLLAIASVLYKVNKPWDEQIERELS